MRLRVCYVIMLFCYFPIISTAQPKLDRKKILDRRLDKIEYYHICMGLDASMNNNYQISPKISMGVGSLRNIFNADIGFKLSLANVLGKSDVEYISYCTLPLFVGGSMNAVRWKQKRLYVGFEYAYSIALGSRYTVSNQHSDLDEVSIAKSHFACQGRLGFRDNDWDISVYYEYDLSPAIDQKYVYESSTYDYFNVHDSIFERWRIGVSAIYCFRF